MMSRKIGHVGSRSTRSQDPSPKKWAAEELTLSGSPRVCICRVCDKPIALAEMSFGWVWRSTERGHAACGWYTLKDLEGVAALRMLGDLRRMPSPDALRNAHELFIVQCRDRVWSLSPVGLALRRLMQAQSAEAAE